MEIKFPTRTILSLALVLLASPAFSLNTQITLTADSDITPSSSELVTFGLPLAEGEVTSTSEIRVLQNGT